MVNPPTTPQKIRTTRHNAKLTQAAAAQLIHVHTNTWKQWEAGLRTPHPAMWELFCLKTSPDSLATNANPTNKDLATYTEKL